MLVRTAFSVCSQDRLPMYNTQPVAADMEILVQSRKALFPFVQNFGVLYNDHTFIGITKNSSLTYAGL